MPAGDEETVSADVYDAFHKLFMEFWSDHPELHDNVQLQKICENCSILVDMSEKQADVIRLLKEENTQLKVDVEKIHQDVYKARQDRDEYVDEVEKNWAAEVQQYVKQLEDGKEERKFLKLHLDEMERELEHLGNEKKKAEEALRAFRDRWENRSHHMTSLLDSSEFETGESDAEGYEGDESKYSSPGGRSMVQHLIGEIQRKDDELNELRARADRVEIPHCTSDLLDELHMLRDDNENLRSLLADRNPSMSPKDVSADRGRSKRTSLMCELNSLDSSANRSFIERTRDRAGSPMFSDVANQTVEQAGDSAFSKTTQEGSPGRKLFENYTDYCWNMLYSIVENLQRWSHLLTGLVRGIVSKIISALFS
ncbi:uncharacterized protein LOC129582659 isoform X2 [Paramacrobiotus metropolitanus]|uniref:uncharacterized protein LOC129582659 isoform X2 n=1 Tax=Paramacrobiotus metropolitanus TaxID=2943436 RepID=UPI002445CF29|nr:uncharacterized protein LOC129582659 isoform X2 [Paramacrobiotus metropolitanus]